MESEEVVEDNTDVAGELNRLAWLCSSICAIVGIVARIFDGIVRRR